MRWKLTLAIVTLMTNVVAVGDICVAQDAHKLTQLGGEMSREDAVSLEEHVKENPHNSVSRTKLLGYYFIKGRQDANAKSAKRDHVLWLIENDPDAEVLRLPEGHLNKILESEGYERAKQAWLRAVDRSPENLSVLQNASSFFLIHDPQIAEELLLKGKALDANNLQLSQSLGQIYSLQLLRLPAGTEKTAIAEKAFRQYEQAYNASEGEERDALLAYLAKTAFAANLIDEARMYANKMLENDTRGWNHGNRVHHGNLILGRIALAAGDIEEAKSRLILAGKTGGSPQLNSFGPNMQLAKELLERGETDAVLEYFDLCKKFWKSPHQKLEQWTEDVKAKRIPEFGGNLNY